MLARLPVTVAERTLGTLDRLARRFPALADYVLTVWRHRPAEPQRMYGGRPIDELRVRPTDPAHQWRAQVEADRSPLLAYVARDPENEAIARRLANRALTGNENRSWLDDLMSRAPFGHAALLGSDEIAHVTAWIRGGASAHLDVYDPSIAVLDTLRHAANDTPRLAGRPTAVRFVRAELNFVELPEECYDVMWASGTLSRVVNLEYLLAQIERALRPGGLFAFNDYVGERRLQYDPDRLARVNAVLATVPERFRIGDGPITSAPLPYLTPLCGIRSDELLAQAAARFDRVHLRTTGALFPLLLAVDLGRMAREAPDLLEGLVAAEQEAAAAGNSQPCGAYAVFRKRG
jgi:SAM-dependent methyltransferase